MKTKTTEFTVEGRGAFPTDMLRYDACYPNSSEDVLSMMIRPGDKRYLKNRKVTLRTDFGDITPARWASFMWHVVGGVSHTF